MQRRYVTVDVFTDVMFGGNPLAVVLDAEGLSGAEMQAIAAEFNYSETTFVLPPREAGHTARVRIFTPRAELPFAGHPNVGTAFALAREGRWPGVAGAKTLTFEEGAGLVPLRLMREGGAVTGAELTAPAPFSRNPGPAPARVAGCLALKADDIALTRHAPEIASVGLPFVIVEIVSRAALARARPNLAAFAETLPSGGADAIFLYTRDVAADDAAVRFQARMFAPLDGILEDPATGSAVCAFAGLQASLDGAADGESSFTVGQGFDMGRPSLLEVLAVRRNGAVVEVRVGGRCAAVMSGSFSLAGSG